MDQNYSNHRKYYPLHHFIFYPALIVMAIYAGFRVRGDEEHRELWWMIIVVIFFVGLLSFMLRQHYALGNQDRIIRVEMRLRYYILTQQRLEPIEALLTFGQLAAIRFASDEQFVELIRKAVDEQLSPNAIKKMVRDWQPDKMRR